MYFWMERRTNLSHPTETLFSLSLRKDGVDLQFGLLFIVFPILFVSGFTVEITARSGPVSYLLSNLILVLPNIDSGGSSSVCTVGQDRRDPTTTLFFRTDPFFFPLYVRDTSPTQSFSFSTCTDLMRKIYTTSTVCRNGPYPTHFTVCLWSNN